MTDDPRTWGDALLRAALDAHPDETVGEIVDDRDVAEGWGVTGVGHPQAVGHVAVGVGPVEDVLGDGHVGGRPVAGVTGVHRQPVR